MGTAQSPLGLTRTVLGWRSGSERREVELDS